MAKQKSTDEAKPIEKLKSMEKWSPTPYERMRKIDVSEYVETKGTGNFKANYLSWAWAVDQLLLHDPDASWEFGEPTVFPDTTVMVYCTVTAFGKARKMHLPVMDNKNAPIKNPSSFAMNTALMRCLVKAIALHGLGLYIYAGEDLPDGQEPEKKPEKPEGKKDHQIVKPLTLEEYTNLKERLENAETEEELDSVLTLLTSAKPRMQKADIDMMAALYKSRKAYLTDNLPI